jgi:predicted Zn-dependent protease
MRVRGTLLRQAIALGAAGLCAVFVASSQTSQDDDPILRAMRDEMDRSRQLRIVGGGDDVPYFISYGLSDDDSFRVSASMGAVITATRNHYRIPNISVRVGSYDFDDTGHIYSGLYSGSRFDGTWPLDDNYSNLRDAFWLATDRAYKAALESMGRKRAALSNANASTEKIADFSQVPPVKNLPKVTRKKIDENLWTARAAKLSAIFASYPEVLASGVEFQAIDGTGYIMNNEGTALRFPDNFATVNARAEGQATDGMLVHDYAVFPAAEVDKLPSEADLTQGVTALAQDIRALVNAPVGEGYSGPVLFEPRAAAQLLAQLLGDNFAAPGRPIAEPGRQVNFVPSEFENKFGSRVVPEFFDVVDDPTQKVWNGKPLAGHEEYDLEGVPDQRVSLVEKGVLKGFVTSRQPVKGFPGANGHARLSGSYGSRGAAITNLFITASQSSPLADLKKKLIDMCKERNKPYGMLVRKLDFPYSAGQAELRALAMSAGGTRPVSPPLLVYRVYADGREELVRGLRFRGVSARSLRDILAASQETALFDYINTSFPIAMVGAPGYLSPTAVVSPGILFEEIEFERPQEQLPKPPVVPPPTMKQ